MTITALPTPPTRQDPASFATRGDDFLAALPVFVEEANALALAMNLNSTTDGSNSALSISTGSKTFTVTAGKSFQPGMYLVMADATGPSTNSMWGQITSYAGTSLVVNVLSYVGSGTKSAWVISQSAPGGASVDGVETLTNKTISGALNTLTNIPQSALASNVVGKGPVVIATGNSQSIPTGTPTDLLLANESIDTGGYFTGGVFTPLVAGYYQVSASVEWGSTAAALSTLGIFKNATAMIIAKGLISSTTASTLNVSYLVYMNGSTDYITARVTQSTAGALNATGSNFSAVLVRSA